MNERPGQLRQSHQLIVSKISDYYLAGRLSCSGHGPCDRRQLVLSVATTILAGRDGQSSRPPASSCAGHRLCRYTVRVNSIDTPSDSHNCHYVNGPARELHRQRAKGARAAADQINLRCKSKSAAGRQQFVRRTLPAAVRQSICHAHVTRRSWQVARRSAQNSREQVILEEIQCRRRSNVQPDAQRAGYGYQQVGSAVPVAD